MPKIDIYLNTETFKNYKATLSAHKYGSNYRPDLDKLEWVGQIEVSDLEHAFFELQHLDRPTLATEILSNKRSLSVGDVLVESGKYHVVRSIGFEEVQY